jgi:hypothetical protein
MKRIKMFEEYSFYTDEYRKVSETYLDYKNGKLSREDTDNFLMKKLNTPGQSVLDKVELKARQLSDKLNKVNLDNFEDRIISHFDELLKWRQIIWKAIYYKLDNITSRRYLKEDSDIILIIFEEIGYLMTVSAKKDLDFILDLFESAICIDLNNEEKLSGYYNNKPHTYPVKKVEEIVENIIEDAKLEIHFERVYRNSASPDERKYSDDTLIYTYEIYFILK